MDAIVIENDVTVIDNFDYQSLDSETQFFVRMRTEQIKEKLRLVLSSVVEIGEKINEVKTRLSHGQFGIWLKNEVGISWQTAHNYMNVANNQEKWANLPSDSQDNIALSGLYFLSGVNIPDEARDEAIARVSNGEKVTKKVAQDIVAHVKEKNQVVTPEVFLYMGESVIWTALNGEEFSLNKGDEVFKSNSVLNDRSKVIVKLPGNANSSITVNLSYLIQSNDFSDNMVGDHQRFTFDLFNGDFVSCDFYFKNTKGQYRFVFKGNVSDSGLNTVHFDVLPDEKIENYAFSILEKLHESYLKSLMEESDGWRVGDVGKLIDIDNSRFEHHVGRFVVVDRVKVDGSLWVHLQKIPSVRFYVTTDYLLRSAPSLEEVGSFESDLDVEVEVEIATDVVKSLSVGDLIEDITKEKMGVVLSIGTECVKVIFANRLVKEDFSYFFQFRAITILSMTENIEQLVSLACLVFDHRYIFLNGELSMTDKLYLENVVAIEIDSANWVDNLISKCDSKDIQNAIAFVDIDTSDVRWQNVATAASGVCFLSGGKKPLTVLFFGQPEIFIRFKRSFSAVGVVLQLI